jgi:hypothetical protein
MVGKVTETTEQTMAQLCCVTDATHAPDAATPDAPLACAASHHELLSLSRPPSAPDDEKRAAGHHPPLCTLTVLRGWNGVDLLEDLTIGGMAEVCWFDR